tara:strand:+ start:2048 stop:2248 length:201 start_codon:yes stop_codon:yes gene_type:complete
MSDVFADNVLKLLKDKIRVIMNDTADHISGGSCRNMEEYSKCVGIIEGLALAERELIDLDKSIADN